MFKKEKVEKVINILKENNQEVNLENVNNELKVLYSDTNFNDLTTAKQIYLENVKVVKSRETSKKIKKIVNRYKKENLVINAKNIAKEYNIEYPDKNISVESARYYLNKFNIIEKIPKDKNKMIIVGDIVLNIITKMLEKGEAPTISNVYKEVEFVYGEKYISLTSVRKCYKEVINNLEHKKTNNELTKEINEDLKSLNTNLANLLNKPIETIKTSNKYLQEDDDWFMQDNISCDNKPFENKTKSIKSEEVEFKLLNNVKTNDYSETIDIDTKNIEQSDLFFFLSLNIIYICLLSLVIGFYTSFMSVDLNTIDNNKVVIENIVILNG